MTSQTSEYRYSSFIRSKQLYKSFESDDINELAYNLYINFTSAIDRLDIYIKDNHKNKLLKIVKDNKSESMIGVDHPIKGHIGYLSFIYVDDF